MPHRKLSSTDHIGGGGIDHHHPGFCGRFDVDVIKPHTRPGDDLEIFRYRESFGIHVGR